MACAASFSEPEPGLLSLESATTTPAAGGPTTIVQCPARLGRAMVANETAIIGTDRGQDQAREEMLRAHCECGSSGHHRPPKKSAILPIMLALDAGSRAHLKRPGQVATHPPGLNTRSPQRTQRGAHKPDPPAPRECRTDVDPRTRQRNDETIEPSPERLRRQTDRFSANA